MKTRINFLFVFLITLFLISNSFAQVLGCENHNCDDGDPNQAAYDEPLVLFYNTWAYSNGFCTGPSGEGCRQCVEFVKRYYGYLGNVLWSGNANEWFDQPEADERDMLLRINEGNIPPTRGNVICFSGNTYGHVGIVYSVDFENNLVTMIDQNRDRNNALKTLPLTVTNSGNEKYYTVAGFGSYITQGWMSVKVGHKHDYSVMQPIINRYSSNLGQPIENGGSPYVHEWYGVWLQDFYGTNTGFYHGNTSIILNPNGQIAHLLKEGFWDAYMNMFYFGQNGPLVLGATTTDEYNQSGYVRQDFQMGFMTFNQFTENKVRIYDNQNNLLMTYDENGNFVIAGGNSNPDVVLNQHSLSSASVQVGSNITATYAIINNGTSTVTYPYMALTLLDQAENVLYNIQVDFDVTIATGQTWIQTRTFNVNSVGGYYTLIRYSFDNLNWTDFTTSTAIVPNPHYFEVIDPPQTQGEARVTDIYFNKDPIYPNDQFNVGFTLHNIGDQIVWYDYVYIMIRDNSGQIIQTLGGWDQIGIYGHQSVTNEVHNLTLPSVGNYYVDIMYQNNGVMNSFAVTGGGINPLSFEVVEYIPPPGEVMVVDWILEPVEINTGQIFNIKAKVEEQNDVAVFYQALLIELLDDQYNVVYDSLLTNVSFAAGEWRYLFLNDNLVLTPGIYYSRVLAQQNDSWGILSASNTSNPNQFDVGGNPATGMVNVSSANLYPETIYVDDPEIVFDFNLLEIQNYPFNHDSVFVLLLMDSLVMDSYGPLVNFDLDPGGEYIGSWNRSAPAGLGLWKFEIGTYDNGSWNKFSVLSNEISNPYYFEVLLPDPGNSNQLINPSFETGSFSPDWIVYNTSNHGIEIITDPGADGDLCVHTLSGNRITMLNSLALMQRVEVDKNTNYVVEFQAKASRRKRIMFTLSNDVTPNRKYSNSARVTLNTQWKNYSVILKSNRNIPSQSDVFLAVQIGGLKDIWIDNISFCSEELMNKVSVADSVMEDIDKVPVAYELKQNFPNPFNPITVIRYDLPQAAQVKISVFNVLGQTVAELIDTYQPAGSHTVTWDGANYPSGIYIYQIQTNGYSEIKKMVLLK